MATCYLLGVSTRRMDKLVQTLGISGFDVSFHTRPLRDSRMRLRRIASLRFVLCASPAYLDRRGRPADPSELVLHDCLTHEHESSWRLDVDGGGWTHRIQRSAFVSNSYLALEKAAVRGRGIALLPLRLAHAAVVAGDLEMVLGEQFVQRRALSAVHGPGAHPPRKVSALLDHVARWFEEHPVADSGAGAREDGPVGAR